MLVEGIEFCFAVIVDDVDVPEVVLRSVTYDNMIEVAGVFHCVANIQVSSFKPSKQLFCKKLFC